VKILVATAHLARIGGLETYVSSLLPRLQQRGYDVTFGYQHPGGTGTRNIEFNGRIVHLDPQTFGRSKLEPDVILLQGRLGTELETELFKVAPVIFVAHDYAGACISGTRTWLFPAPAVCDRALGPGCLLHYFPHRCGGINPVLGLRLFSEERIRQGNILKARKVMVSSSFVGNVYRKGGVQTQQLIVNPLFVSPPEVKIPKALPSERTLMFLGRLTKTKGVALLLEAVKRAGPQLGRCRLLIAGEGPERRFLERVGRTLKIEIEFLGWTEPVVREEILKTATAIVIPSVWPEPFGIVGLEAARYGVPAVAFPVGGIPEWLTGGVNGELAKRVADPEALALALLQALSGPEHYRALSSGALAVAGRFGEDRHMNLLAQAIEEAGVTAE
jgi:glycosyltransferase involved in cell wall biosynthesis